MTNAIYAGLMSGTSMDGVDAVLADFSQAQPHVLSHIHLPYPAPLLSRLQNASRGAALSANQWLDLDHQVGQHFSQATATLLKTAELDLQQVCAIGTHGQTIWHQADGENPNSWQIGDPNLIAGTTGLPVVADFRRMDIALGGQGAPLAPAFHAAIFADPAETRVILNLGGIANITTLAPGKAVIGYDTGPANCLLDSHYRKVFDQAYDKDGAWAATGQSQPELVASMLRDSYFASAAPKSTGPEYFSWGWVTHYLQQHPCSDADLQASLVELSCLSITQDIHRSGARQVIACGGGVQNSYLMQRISQTLPADCTLVTTDEYGIDPQQVEALAFAWLAKQRIEQKPANLPSVTGASRACLLGSIYQA